MCWSAELPKKYTADRWQEGGKEGRKKGRKKEMKKGRREGRKEGRKKGRNKGRKEAGSEDLHTCPRPLYSFNALRIHELKTTVMLI